LAFTFSQAISKFFRLYTLSINEWTFFASVGLIQFASLLGRRRTGVSLIELFHLAALAHLVLFLSPSSLPAAFPDPLPSPIARLHRFHGASGTTQPSVY
jgi:hypothetical protein